MRCVWPSAASTYQKLYRAIVSLSPGRGFVPRYLTFTVRQTIQTTIYKRHPIAYHSCSHSHPNSMENIRTDRQTETSASHRSAHLKNQPPRTSFTHAATQRFRLKGGTRNVVRKNSTLHQISESPIPGDSNNRMIPASDGPSTATKFPEGNLQSS